MKKMFYCDKWSGNYKEPIGIMTESQAADAHERKKTYTVLVDSETKPTRVVDVGDKFVFVAFLDDKLREKLSYRFGFIEIDKFFLKMTIERKFDGDSDTVVSGKEFTFKPDGLVHVREVTRLPETIVDEYDVLADISGCYEKYPEFGDYDRFIIPEREIQPV